MKQRQIRYGDKAWNKLIDHVKMKKESEEAKLHHATHSSFIRYAVDQQIKRESN